MSTDAHRPHIPASRRQAILAFDIRRFSAFTDTQRTLIATEFRDCIESAFTGDLAQAWRDRVFEQDGGDGITVGFDDRHLGDLVDLVPAALQRELRGLDQRTGLNVRMRLGIAVGPIQRTSDERVGTAPNQAIIDACRIADSRPTRLLLENSDERATYLAVAVTPTVMAETVGPDPKWLRASEFVEVNIHIEEKDYHASAFLHVPAPSGPLLKFGLSNLHGGPLSADDADVPLEERVERAGQTWPPALRASGDRAAQTVGIGGDTDDRSVRTGNVDGRSVVTGAGSRVQQDNSDHRDQRRNYAGRDNVVSHGGNAQVSNVERGQGRPRPFWLDEEDERA